MNIWINFKMSEESAEVDYDFAQERRKRIMDKYDLLDDQYE